jgi:hypothetical protein
MSHVSTEFEKHSWGFGYKAACFTIHGDNEKWELIILELLPGNLKELIYNFIIKLIIDPSLYTT